MCIHKTFVWSYGKIFFMKKHFLFCLTLFVIGSCSITPPNPYTQFYTANANFDRGLLPTDEVEILKYSWDSDSDWYWQLITNNYEEVGRSNFNGSIYEDSFAIQHAKNIGAELVVLTNTFTDTNTYTSSVVSYGFGVAPITSTQRRFDQIAVYFVKRDKKLKFGYFGSPLTTEEKQSNETNYGIKVNAVLNDHPMFYAGVIPGDILLEIDGKKIVANEDVKDENNESIFKILRNKKKLEIKVITGE